MTIPRPSVVTTPRPPYDMMMGEVWTILELIDDGHVSEQIESLLRQRCALVLAHLDMEDISGDDPIDDASNDDDEPVDEGSEWCLDVMMMLQIQMKSVGHIV